MESPPTDPVPVSLNAAQPPLQVRFRSNLRLNDAPWQVVRWGRGQVTLLIDLSLFANQRLINHDHADFLWALFQQNPAGGAFWLQYRMLTPSLVELLWQRAWMPLLGILLTLLATLWRYSRRLGPCLTPRSSEQRRLAEHLQASSRFLWRHGHYTQRRRPEASAEPVMLEQSDQPLNERDLIHTVQTLQRLNRRP